MMCVVLILEAICVAINNTGAGIAAVVFVFLFEAAFTWGWMGCVWVYPPVGPPDGKVIKEMLTTKPQEILPLKIRAKGAALAAAADFLGNFLVVEVTPPGIKNLGYRFYIVWAVLNIANATIVWLFYPETAGIPLEQIDFLFTDDTSVNEMNEKQPFYRKMQWSIVAKASAEVKRQKRLRNTLAAGPGSEGAMVEESASDKSKGSVEHVDKQ